MEGGLLSFSPLVRAWVLEIFTFALKKTRLTEARKSSLTARVKAARLLFSSRDSHY